MKEMDMNEYWWGKGGGNYCYKLGWIESKREEVVKTLGWLPTIRQVLELYNNTPVAERSTSKFSCYATSHAAKGVYIYHLVEERVPEGEDFLICLGRIHPKHHLNGESFAKHFMSPLSERADVDRLLSRPGTLIETQIDSPRFIHATNSVNFEISEFGCSKELSTLYVAKGGLFENASEHDWLYNLHFKLDVWPKGGDRGGPGSDSLISESHDMTFQELCGIRHDFVANCLRKRTDESFHKLGINSPMTPDVISVERRSILELATNASGMPKSLESSFISKRIQYEAICNENKIEFHILVVSTSMILTNITLDDQECSNLCDRCLIGMNIESRIESELDMVLSSDEDRDKSHKEIRAVMADFNSGLELPEHYHFNKELIELNRPLSPRDEEHVKAVYAKSLKDALTGVTAKTDTLTLGEYLSNFTEENTQRGRSQITIFPMIIGKNETIGHRSNFKPLGSNRTVPSHLYSVAKWLDSKNYLMGESLHISQIKIQTKALAEEIDVGGSGRRARAPSVRLSPKHVNRENFKVVPFLTDKEELQIALKGVGAKVHAEDGEVLMKEARKKKSFHPESPTDDIEDFWNRGAGYVEDMSWQVNYKNDVAYQLVCRTKNENPYNISKTQDSTELLHTACMTEVSFLGDMITDICTEIAMEYKVPTKSQEWLCKPLTRHKVVLFLKCTGSHNFFFLCYEKGSNRSIDTGDIGPEIFETSNYFVSNICSITEGYLEHFLKAGSYIPLIVSHLLCSFQVNFMQPGWDLPSDMCQTMNYIVLTYLNNKIDHEEMLTNLRFLYMKLLQEVGANTKDYVDRLPEVLRSRLSVFTLKRIRQLVDYYSQSRIMRRREKVQGENDWQHRNIRLIYHTGFVSLEQLIDSFYYSYVVSKNKSAMGDQNFKIYSKVFREEMKGYRTVETQGISIWGKRLEPRHHCWDYAVERKKIDISMGVLRERHGPEYLTMIKRRIYDDLSRCSFTDLATLKASARAFARDVASPEVKMGMTRSEYKKSYHKLNPSMMGKRPRVITNLVDLINQYREKTKDDNPTPLKLSCWSLKELLSTGYLICELFIKDQHNGVREIHVLEIAARVVQYIVERICKSICQFFENDTVSRPETKKRYYKDHMRESEAIHGEFVSINKSADASKWCQRNHVSQFFFDLYMFTPPEFHKFIYCFYYLWTKKRVFVNWQMADNLERNRSVLSSNKEYCEMREAYHNGDYPFLEQRGMFVHNSFGMWQGIQHEASCLKHNLEQTAWKALTESFFRVNLKIPVKITIVQGSDDSGAMISVRKPSKAMIKLISGLLWWKESLSEYSSIWTSKAKSSVGTANLLEYNSEWWFNGKNIRPVFRFNSACMETSMVERFSDRIDQFYNSLTQSLESGASTLLCSAIQMLQAILHYRMLGLSSHVLGSEAANLILDRKDIALGYFPLEIDQICGITGLDYQLYLLSKQGVKVSSAEMELRSNRAVVEYDGKVEKVMRDNLTSYSVKFNNVKDYLKVLRATKLTRLSRFVDKLLNSPELLYINSRTWEQQELKMSMMLESPSVRSALSGHQPTARLMSASAYIIGTPCVTGREGPSGTIKRSLISWLRKENYSSICLKDETWFMNQEQYGEFTDFLLSLKGSITYQSVDLRRTSRVNVEVWGSQSDVEIPLMDMVKRKWFGLRSVPCSRTAFKTLWDRCKVKYPFIKDTYSETKKALNVTDIGLYKLIQSVETKIRKINLSDTTAKSPDLWSTATRIFWPKIKVRSINEASESSLRELKNGLHCVLSYFFKRAYALDLSKTMVKSNRYLSEMKSHIPNKAYRLKVFHDFLNGANRWDIIEKIEAARMGCVGYFQTEQKKSDKGYKGTGVWVGLVDSVPCRIRMMDNQVESITLQRLTDVVSQPRTISQVIRDFKLDYPDSQTKSPTGLYMTSKSNFVKSAERPEKSVPLLLDRSFRPDVKTRILAQDWSIDSEGSTLKLIFTERSGTAKARQFTILSETFSGFHWDPLLPAPNVADQNFRNWCRGLPCKPMTMLDQLRFPKERSDVINAKITLDRKSLIRPDTEYSIPRFIQQFFGYIGRKVRGSTFNELKYEYDSMEKTVKHTQSGPDVSEEALSKIKDNTLSFLMDLQEGNYENVAYAIGDGMTGEVVENKFFGTDLFEEWADDEEEVMEEGYGFEEGNVLTDNLDEVIDMFKNPDTTLKEIAIDKARESVGNIKQLNLFLAPFLDLLDDMPNSPDVLQQLKTGSLEDDTKLYGVGGSILYVMGLGGEYVGSTQNILQDVLEITPIGELSSVSSAQGVGAQDLEVINVEITQIEGIIGSVSGPLKDSLNKRLKKLKTERDYINRVTEIGENSGSLSGLEKSHVLLKLYETLKTENLWNPGFFHPNDRIMVELLVSSSLENTQKVLDYGLLSQREVEIARATAWSGTLSEELIRIICLNVGCSITFIKNGSQIYSYVRTLFRASVDVVLD
nr:MAG: RNA-dependent RNA polymerase [Jiangsu sediment phenui-like virus]